MCLVLITLHLATDLKKINIQPMTESVENMSCGKSKEMRLVLTMKEVRLIHCNV